MSQTVDDSPFLQANGTELRVPREWSPRDTRHALHRWPSRAVVVDFRDESFVALRLILRRYGMRVIRIHDSSGLSSQLDRHHPDLMLVNAEMPGVTAHLANIAGRLSPDTVVWHYTALLVERSVEADRAVTSWVFAYGGDLFWLMTQVERCLAICYRNYIGGLPDHAASVPHDCPGLVSVLPK